MSASPRRADRRSGAARRSRSWMPRPTAARTYGARPMSPSPPELRPGGADFGHIELAEQRRLKQKVLRDALQRIGGLDIAASIRPAGPILDGGDVVAEESPDGTGWRTRVSLHVDEEGRVGPYAARSHHVIPPRTCPWRRPRSARAARELRSGEPGRIDLVQPADGRVRVLPAPGGDTAPGRPCDVGTPRPDRPAQGSRAGGRARAGARRETSASTRAASGRCTAWRLIRSPTSSPRRSPGLMPAAPCPGSIPKHGTSTSTAAWDSSPPRSATSADRARA